MVFIDYLKISFLVIFIATAVIGLGSLPNWIKIPEWYRKKIFIALILEVVAALLFLFRQEIVKDPGGSGDIIHDTIYINTIGKICCDTVISTEGLKIKDDKGENLATISKDKLREIGLFNSIESSESKDSKVENFKYIEWGKDTSKYSSWKQNGDYFEPFKLDIYDDGAKTQYRIILKEQDTVFSYVASDSKNLFDLGNRITHFYKFNGTYHLLRIDAANLRRKRKFIRVLQIKFKPIIE